MPLKWPSSRRVEYEEEDGPPLSSVREEEVDEEG